VRLGAVAWAMLTDGRTVARACSLSQQTHMVVVRLALPQRRIQPGVSDLCGVPRPHTMPHVGIAVPTQRSTRDLGRHITT
jgi:hypothetical protein